MFFFFFFYDISCSWQPSIDTWPNHFPVTHVMRGQSRSGHTLIRESPLVFADIASPSSRASATRTQNYSTTVALWSLGLIQCHGSFPPPLLLPPPPPPPPCFSHLPLPSLRANRSHTLFLSRGQHSRSKVKGRTGHT